jgi:L-rhamnose mutarotase
MTKIFRFSWLYLIIASSIIFYSFNVQSDKNTKINVQRYGSVIGLRAEKLDDYKKLHAAVWPGVAKQIRECNIRNYSIYLKRMDDGNYYLFSYFEYIGVDFKADMAKMAADTTTQRWWKVTDPCQKPLTNRQEGEWWASMEEVFHQD